LKTSLITGPEYAGMTEARLPLFWGLEDPSLYNAHVAAFKESVPLEKEAAKTYRTFTETLASVQRRVFNPDLLDLNRRRALYERGELKLGDYLQFLSQGISLSSFPQAQAFLQSLDLERKLDYARIEEERREVAQALARALPKDKLAELARAALA